MSDTQLEVTPNMPESFSKQVWQTLSKIDVNNHINKKGKLSYLSWAWAWGVLMGNFPESYFEFLNFDDKPYKEFPDGSAEVWVSVNLKNGDQNLTRQMWLPVMDFKNDPILHPNSRQINDSRMRCLTKCLALFGLGHYIYAGEDIPDASEKIQTVVEKISEAQVKELTDLLDQSGIAKPRFHSLLNIKELSELPLARYASVKTRLNTKIEEVEAA